MQKRDNQQLILRICLNTSTFVSTNKTWKHHSGLINTSSHGLVLKQVLSSHINKYRQEPKRVTTVRHDEYAWSYESQFKPQLQREPELDPGGRQLRTRRQLQLPYSSDYLPCAKVGPAGSDPGDILYDAGQPAGVPGCVWGAATTEHDQLLPHVPRHRWLPRLHHRYALRNGRRDLWYVLFIY